MGFWKVHDITMLKRTFHTSCKEEPMNRAEATSTLFEPLKTCFPVNSNNNAKFKRGRTMKENNQLQLLKEAAPEDCTLKTDTDDTEPIKRFVKEFFVQNNIDPVNIPPTLTKSSEEELSKSIFNYYYYTVKDNALLLENPRVIARINGVPYVQDRTVTHDMVVIYCNYWLDILQRSILSNEKHLLSKKLKVKKTVDDHIVPDREYGHLLACQKEHLKQCYPCSIPFNEENASHDDRFPLGMNDKGELCKMSPYELQCQRRQRRRARTHQQQHKEFQNS